MKRPFFPTEIEARRELARRSLVSKHNYYPQINQFDVLNDPRWQANIEANQGRFQLDRYRPFAFEHGNMVYNPPWLDPKRTQISCHPYTRMITPIN